MHRAERQNDPVEALRQALEGKQAELWTALPGIIESFNPAAITATVQPALQCPVYNESGAASFVDLPLLYDVPVEFPNGGGFSLTFPVKPGDECSLVFQCRCLDGWWLNGGVAAPLEQRLHDLSDAICRVGPRSQKRLLTPAINTQAAQLRTDNGQAHISLYPDYTIEAVNPAASVTLTPAGEVAAQGKTKISLAAPLVEIACGGFTMRSLGGGELTAQINANIKQQGGIESSGDHKAGNVSLQSHTHSGVEPGSSNTGGPN